MFASFSRMFECACIYAACFFFVSLNNSTAKCNCSAVLSPLLPSSSRSVFAGWAAISVILFCFSVCVNDNNYVYICRM